MPHFSDTKFIRGWRLLESNTGFHWFCFAALIYWSRKLAPSFQAVSCKTETSRDLTLVFPRLKLMTCGFCDFKTNFGFMAV